MALFDEIQPVPPVDPSADRPLWSVLIPVFNCISFLPQTLESVLRQDPGEDKMQILVLDDASSDGDVEALVKELGRGRIEYRRQQSNVGSLQNFYDCLLLSRGRYIHLLHGDDFIHDGFYKKMDQLFDLARDAGAACCRYRFVNENSETLNFEMIEQEEEGILKDWLLKLASKQRLQYCAVVVKREVYEKLGSFYGVNYGEDWEMWARIAAKYAFVYTPDVLASYRRLQTSISGQGKKSGENTRKILWVIDKIQAYLPAEKRAIMKRSAIQWYSRYTMASAFSIWAKTRDSKSAVALMKTAIKLRSDSFIIWRSLLLQTRILLRK